MSFVRRIARRPFRISLAAVAIAATALASAGCGMLKVETHGFGSSSGGGGGTSGAAPGEAPSEGRGDDAENAKRVLAAFRAFDFASCAGSDCANKLIKQARVSEYRDRATYVYMFNPRRVMKNPDPEWIPGWDKLSGDEHANDARKVYSALAIAAAARTWTAKCRADYADVHKQLLEKDDAMATSIGEAKRKENPYTRLDALLKLRTRDADNGFESRLATRVGGRHALETAILEGFREAGRDYLYTLQHLGPDNDLGARLRARGTLEAERDSYCAHAVRNATAKTTAFSQDYELRQLHGVVKSPVPEAHHAKAEERHNNRNNPFQGPRLSDIGLGSEHEIEGHPKLQHVTTDLAIKSVKREGTDLVVDITNRSTEDTDYDCVTTNRVVGINLQTGQYRFQEVCKTGKSVSDYALRATFSELPEGVTLQVGDVIDFYGIVKTANKKQIANSPAYQHESTEYVVKAEHLVGLRRNKSAIAHFFSSR